MGVWPDWFGYLSVRLRTDDMSGAVGAVRFVWESLIPEIPFEPFFLDDSLSQQYQSEQRMSRVFATFSAMAVVTACLGLFGLISFLTEQRTREIGVRKVLGASVGTIVVMLSWDLVKLVLTANVVAVPITCLVMEEWLQDFAYRVEIGPPTFLISAGLTLGVAMATVAYQALRASLQNPVDALQCE